MNRNCALMALLITFSAFNAKSGSPQFTPVSGFEASRYLGTWYEIARMPTVFENGLIRVTATYSPDQKNGISVVNRGVKKSSGKEKEANGRAKFASDTATGRLKVSFFGPFYSDYIIVELDTVNYAWSMVAGSSEDYLWILSRTPSIDGAVLKNLMQKAKSLGFNLSRLYMVPQE